ncbi:MAG: DUF4838 domain-containing protein, partial [Lentisphaeria bacterium]
MRFFSCIYLCVLLCLSAVSQAGYFTTTLSATADTYVESDRPEAGFHDRTNPSTQIRGCRERNRAAFYRFDLPERPAGAFRVVAAGFELTGFDVGSVFTADFALLPDNPRIEQITYGMAMEKAWIAGNDSVGHTVPGPGVRVANVEWTQKKTSVDGTLHRYRDADSENGLTKLVAQALADPARKTITLMVFTRGEEEGIGLYYGVENTESFEFKPHPRLTVEIRTEAAPSAPWKALMEPGTRQSIVEGTVAAVLAQAGESTCTIVLPPDAIDEEKLAAEELAAYIQHMSGARPDVTAEKGDGTNVYLGWSDAISSMLPDIELESLAHDTVVIRTIDDDLVITGGRRRGTRNAVYHFLQRVCGVRWWAPDAGHIPSQPTLAVPDLDIVYSPQFTFRYDSGESCKHRVFRDRNFNNGASSKFDPDGESILHYLVPKSQCVEHPEWFMYCAPEQQNVDNGKYTFALGFDYLKDNPEQHKVAKETNRLPFQPCMTSESARETAVANAFKRLEETMPGMATYSPQVLWVVQQDGKWMCRCEGCETMRATEGSDAAGWLMMANAVAEAIEAQYPDVLVGIHAYLHTIVPPKTVRPRDNVLIYMASLDRDQKKDFWELQDGQHLQAWCDIAKYVWVWDYDTNFRNYIKPHPNYLSTSRNIKFAAEAGASGYRMQGAHGKL